MKLYAALLLGNAQLAKYVMLHAYSRKLQLSTLRAQTKTSYSLVNELA